MGNGSKRMQGRGEGGDIRPSPLTPSPIIHWSCHNGGDTQQPQLAIVSRRSVIMASLMELNSLLGAEEATARSKTRVKGDGKRGRRGKEGRRGEEGA